MLLFDGSFNHWSQNVFLPIYISQTFKIGLTPIPSEKDELKKNVFYKSEAQVLSSGEDLGDAMYCKILL